MMDLAADAVTTVSGKMPSIRARFGVCEAVSICKIKVQRTDEHYLPQRNTAWLAVRL